MERLKKVLRLVASREAKLARVFISREGAKNKFGVWEDGKKIRWFSKEEVYAVESGQIEDLRVIFSENPEASANKIAEFTR